MEVQPEPPEIAEEQEPEVVETIDYASWRDVEPAELALTFSFYDIAELDRFQRGDPESVAIQPLSEAFVELYPKSSALLAANTTTYDDEMEDALACDEVIEMLMEAARTDPRNSDIRAAMRVRRSVIICSLMAFHG